jgi:hypothetical protein
VNRRALQIVFRIALTVAALCEITYRFVKVDLTDLAGARYPQNAEGLGGAAIIVLCCIAYFAVAARWPRRDEGDRPPLGVAAFLTFVVLFVYANAIPDSAERIPGGVYFVLQTLFWDVGGILVLFIARSNRGAPVNALRAYAIALVLLQSIVGIIGASRAGDPMMSLLAGAAGFVSIVAMLALAVRRDWFEPAEPARS